MLLCDEALAIFTTYFRYGIQINGRDEMDENLQRLVDRTEIQDVFMLYASSVDRCDWLRLQSVFTDEIERDLSSLTGKLSENINSEQHVDECRSTLPGFDSTQHFLLNNDISIHGDQAKAIVYLIADHTLIEEGVQRQFTLRGFYTFRFIRIDANWKICAMTLTVLSTQGDQNIFEVAGRRVATMNETQRNAMR